MSAFNVEFDVVCAICGDNLDVETETQDGQRLVIKVQPCVVCMNRAIEEGRAAGYEDGVHSASMEGFLAISIPVIDFGDCGEEREDGDR